MAEELDAAAHEALVRGNAAVGRGDLIAALRYYEYAQRLAPTNTTITLVIGTTRLSQKDPRAAEAFMQVVAHDDVREAWHCLAASRYHLDGQIDLAAQSLRTLLSRHGLIREGHALHDAIAREHGAAGWCGLSADGRLCVTLFGPKADLNRVVILFDGVPVGSRPRQRSADRLHQRATYFLSDAWRLTKRVAVCIKGQDLFGSPLEADVIGQMEGFVSVRNGDLSGWAWFPRDPACIPRLTIRDVDGNTLRIEATEPALDVMHIGPLAKPRLIAVPGADLRRFIAPVAVLDCAGRNLYGSPLDPLAERRSATGAAELAQRLFPASSRTATHLVDLPLPSVPADIVGAHTATRHAVKAAGIDVVIPVYRGRDTILACIESVLGTLPLGARCIVVEDASPEAEVIKALEDLGQQGRIVLLRQKTNRGFPATANAGIRAAGSHDVILLNSDTMVPPGWIERLAEAAYSATDIGTATPFSNDATIFSYPYGDAPNPIPDKAATISLDRLARRANAKRVVDVPTAHGFCVYLRRDCIGAVGLLRDDVFAQGYGEENDFCIRARHLGWRHVAVPGVFVTHFGGNSFGDAKAHLMTRNLAVLNRLHPGYDALIAAFIRTDPLSKARFRMDALRWHAGRSRNGSVIFITHSRAGGVERRVAERCAAIAASGVRPIVLSPAKSTEGHRQCQLGDGSGAVFPNLRFNIEASLNELASFLRKDRPACIELHHFIGHDPGLFGLAHALDVPYDVVIHDYAWICPRINLIAAEKRYCGEPDSDACEGCYIDMGGTIEEDIPPSRLRRRSQNVLTGARRVVVPSRDVAGRLARYFPDVACVVTPWESDALSTAPEQRSHRERLRVAVVGAIGVEKGYEYLLACARHTVKLRLPLEFVVVGHTCDDKRLWDTGVVHITGEYREAEANELIRAQQADVGFLPALWPETWSYTLTQLWQAGLEVVAFDIGAPAERIRLTHRGRVVPLGLPPAAMCAILLEYGTNDEAANADTRGESNGPKHASARHHVHVGQ
jgi:GT2 family glycosyltransferase